MKPQIPMAEGDDFPEPHMRPVELTQQKVDFKNCQFVDWSGFQLTHINEIPVADIDWRTGLAKDERQEPLPPPFTAEEHLQTVQSAWNGLTVSLAIVCAIFAGVLVVHAAARAGWLP